MAAKYPPGRAIQGLGALRLARTKVGMARDASSHEASLPHEWTEKRTDRYGRIWSLWIVFLARVRLRCLSGRLREVGGRPLGGEGGSGRADGSHVEFLRICRTIYLELG